MNAKEVSDFWLEEAEEALRVAGHLFEKQDYSYALFFGHLAVEKLIKAIYVVKKNEQAPYTHNLIRLAESAGIQLNEQKIEDLAKITAFATESRYPDEKRSFRKKCTADFTEKELSRTGEVFKWLKSIL